MLHWKDEVMETILAIGVAADVDGGDLGVFG